MKILFVSDGITPYVIGGMQRHSENLVRGLVGQSVEITLIHCVVGDSKIPGERDVQDLFPQADIKPKVICIRFPKGDGFPGHYIRSSKKYSRLCFESIAGDLNSYDFIYTKGFTGFHFLRNKHKLGCPIGVMLHGFEMFQPGEGIKQELQKKALRNIASFCISQSDVVFSYGGRITPLVKSLGVEDQKIIETPGGVDRSWLRGNWNVDPSTTLRFLFVGRNEKRKGLEDLYGVLKTIKEDFEFHFIGPLPSIEDSRFIYHGELGNKETLINIVDSCDVLVCPSHSEGMPNVIMEGMSRGLAIVATDVGASSVLVDGSNGWLIPPFDSTALKNAIVDAVRSDSLSSKKRKSLERIKSFTFDQLAIEFVRRLEMILR